MSTRGRRRLVSKRLLSLVAAACVLGIAAASLSSAAPIYTGWSAPVNLGPVVNSTAAEMGPALSPDGLSLYISVTRPGGLGGLDIWVSRRPALGGAWGAPVNLGPAVNTASTDFVPAFSADGHWLFFASDRLGGFGLQDIYRAYRADVHDDFAWQAPVNLGPNVNGSADDNASTYWENDGHGQLIFGSGRLGGAARDLFQSNLQADGTWSPATLIPELSGPTTENRPTIRQDGLEIFFYSDRTGGSGGNDLWTSTRASVDAPWSPPVNLGATVNSSASDQHPYLSLDAQTLIFASARPGGSGATDLYMMTRTRILPTTKDDCKQDGWKNYGVFKNQGDCVSYLATNGANEPG